MESANPQVAEHENRSRNTQIFVLFVSFVVFYVSPNPSFIRRRGANLGVCVPGGWTLRLREIPFR